MPTLALRRLVFVLAALTLAPGCKSFGVFIGGEPGEVTYSTRAEENMKRGQEQLDSRNYLEASRYFDHVRTKFPFLELAKEAELKLGDTDFAREKYAEARERYQSFVRLHPNHAKVDYAAFRAALTHYKDIPSDLFLFPPAAEKDQVEIRAALAAMSDFVRGYPESSLVKEADAVVLDCRRRLADHELYVADFYARRGRPLAVVQRLSNVATQYPGAYPDRVAFGLHDAYLELKKPDEARRALESFLLRSPEDPQAPRARRLLASLPGADTPSAAAPDAGN